MDIVKTIYQNMLYMWILILLFIIVKHANMCVQIQGFLIRKKLMVCTQQRYAHMFHAIHDYMLVHDKVCVHMDMNKVDTFKSLQRWFCTFRLFTSQSLHKLFTSQSSSALAKQFCLSQIVYIQSYIS